MVKSCSCTKYRYKSVLLNCFSAPVIPSASKNTRVRLRLLHEKGLTSFGPRVLRNYGRTIGKQCVCVLIWESRKARTLLGVSGLLKRIQLLVNSPRACAASASPDATPLWNSGQCVNSAPAVPDAVRSSATTAPRCVGKHPRQGENWNF